MHLSGNKILVDWGSNVNIPFQEVINLLGNDSVLEFRNANVPNSGRNQMPGIRQERFILLNGVFVNNKSFFDWYDYCKTNSVKRQAVVIKLFDESGLPIMSWKFPDAYAVAISSPVLLPIGIDIALERISFNFGNVILSNGS